MGTLYNGVKFPVSGPDLDNVERIDNGARPMLLHMMQTGLQVDLDHFKKMERELSDDMDAATEKVRELTGHYVNLDSGDQVSDLLFKKLGLKQAKPKLTKSGDRESVENEVLVAIQHEHESIGVILNYKEYSKLKGTYVVPMPKLARRAKRGEWRMYPNLGDTRVPSGRLNCKEPNLLAMPSRTARGRQIKEGFIAGKGRVFLSVDESQIEPRVGAHNSGDPRLISIYENGEDIYSDFAISAFSLPDTRHRDGKGKWQYPGVDKNEHRTPSKTCVLAAIYDVSPMGLAEQMPVICANCRKPTTSDKAGVALHDCGKFESLWHEGACERLLNAFYLTYPGLLADRKRNHGRARQYGYIWDMWGRILHVGAVRSIHPWVVSAALREVGNFPYQSGAQGTIKLTMAAVMDDLEASGLLEKCDPVLQIHDELLFEVDEDVADEIEEHVKWRFETCAPLRVPIKAGGARAATWGSIEK